MEQYFINREIMSLNLITESIVADKVFANERMDKNWDKSHLVVNYCTFAKIGFLSSKFRLCNFAHCTFIDCYFRKAEFHQIDFTGCAFINCNFEQAQLDKCNFQYAAFENCFFPYKEMQGSLPVDQENLCSDICRKLSLQCLKAGDTENYRAYLFREKEASERHHWLKAFHRSNHDKKSYYEKYTFLERVEGVCKCILGKANRYLWGYGEKIWVLIRNSLLIILVYTLIYFRYDVTETKGQTLAIRLIAATHNSVKAFFLMDSGFNMSERISRWVITSENVLGVLVLGFFVAALFRFINRR